VTVADVEAALIGELAELVRAVEAEGATVPALCLGVTPSGGGRSAWGTPEGFVLVGLDAVDAHGPPGLRPALAAALARQLQASLQSPVLARADLSAAELEADCLAGALLGLAGGREGQARALVADPPRDGADPERLSAPARAAEAAAGLSMGLARLGGGPGPLPPRAALRACAERARG
jgi:hypothetical protein